MLNNYDNIANYYDVLSRLVFFRAQVKAQIQQLTYIPANASVLIVGGGTGWILEEIAKIHQTGLTITYVEISSKMLALSKKREAGSNTVEFIHSSIEDLHHKNIYDVIITAFLFDNFSEERVGLIFNQLHSCMADKGLWLFTDFFYEEGKGKKWQLYLLKMMYLFFRYISNVEAKSLIHTAEYFLKKGYTKLNEQYYYGRFIKSIVYRKSNL